MGFYKHLFAHLDGSCTNKDTAVSLAPSNCKQMRNGKTSKINRGFF